MSEPITNLSDAVREYGALPVPLGSPADRQLAALQSMVATSDSVTTAMATVADASALVAGLTARVAELELERSKYVGAEPTIAEEMAYLSRCLDSVLSLCDEQDKAARLFELSQPEWIARVREAADGLVERTSYPPALPWARLMDDEDLAEFIDELADAATRNATGEERLAAVEEVCGTWRLIAEAQDGHNTAPGPDAVTQVFVPVASPREVMDGEHYALVHHDYRTGHDRPETGGSR
ncbi:hypothetical protein [Streptomyces sp. B21-083]|uniref:hypothetical protein n=1 Tax=Streptomyces sp. B21-083 TaxID=3039410 RepID=UPI002FF2B84A